MKILVTGSSGYAGSHIVALLQQNHEPVGIDLLPGSWTRHRVSLSDKDFLLRITEGADAIVHTASLHAPHVETHSRSDFIETNIQGTLNLLEVAQENGIKKFVYTSSTSLYGRSLEHEDRAVWVDEQLPCLPRDIYDISKLAAEGLCRDFFHRERLQSTVLRVSRFWEEPMKDRIFYRMYRGLDVRDVAAAHLLALEKNFERPEVYNISAQSIFGLEDLLELRQEPFPILKEKIPELLAFYKKMSWELPTSIDRVYVIEKAKRELGYAPRYNIREMLQELANNPPN